MAMQKVEETAHRIRVLLGEHSPHDDTSIFFERQEFVLKSSLRLNGHARLPGHCRAVIEGCCSPSRPFTAVLICNLQKGAGREKSRLPGCGLRVSVWQ